jgi:hypothetical protein
MSLWIVSPQTILSETKYFQTLTKRMGNILTIVGRDAFLVGRPGHKTTITLLVGHPGHKNRTRETRI